MDELTFLGLDIKTHRRVEEIKVPDAEEISVTHVNPLDLYHKVYNENILIMYKGIVTLDLVISMVDTLKQRSATAEAESPEVQKAFHGAVSESMHNLYYYMDEIKDRMKGSSHDTRSGLITIIAKKELYNIITGHFIPSVHIEELKASLEKINHTDSEELSSLYKETLSRSDLQDHENKKNAVALGLIQLARKTAHKLGYKIDPIDHRHAYFTLQAQVNRV